jgi:hypothetical protein
MSLNNNTLINTHTEYYESQDVTVCQGVVPCHQHSPIYIYIYMVKLCL